MRISTPMVYGVFVFACLLLSWWQAAFAQVERFVPAQGGETEIWRITHDPTIRHWANYHNQNCWSADGRYICYTRYEPYDRQPSREIFIYDLHEDKEIRVDNGINPRWAKNHNWLFYVKPTPEDGPADGKGTHVMWLDVDTNKRTRIAYGVPGLGNTDYQDRWLYGYVTYGRDANPPRQAYRIPIRPDSRPEKLDGLHGAQWIGNPAHPVIFSRHDHGDPNATDKPFEATRFWCDLEGKNIVIGSPMIQRCHQSWSGDGKYHLHGNAPVAGRLWNEPFPSNLHVLSAVRVGDVSPCGKSGRWICGSSNQGPLQIIDLWSGDGYNYLEAAASFIHDDDKFGYSYGSALEDNDSKGSADGTKICFVTNYDLKNGPVTYTVARVPGIADRIVVESTNGFPEAGRLSVGNEVIGYARKTPASFEGLTRRMYHTTSTNLEYLTEAVRREYRERKSDTAFIQKRGLNILRKLEALYSKRAPDINQGTRITSFESRLIPEGKRRALSQTSRFVRDDFPGYRDSPLMWQNRTDVYVAVVRLPDQPHLRTVGDEAELIPGENHWETYGYHIRKGGRKLTDQPLRPGTFFTLLEAGTYTATAVEWSGLESRESLPIRVQRREKLHIRVDKPADFSWTSEHWLVEGKEVSAQEAKNAEHAVKELVHIVDGVLHREWYNRGQITRRYDLNPQGRAIRRLFYQDGKLARREYHHGNGWKVSTEYFDADGYITRSILYRMADGQLREYSHYWYQKGMPVKHVGNSVRHSAPLGPGLYVKEGDRWVKKN